jgi:transketolase N-terminal domain/subunit
MKKQSLPELQKICSQLRRDVLRMVHAVQSGHPGAPLGCAEYFVALYHLKDRLSGSVINTDCNIPDPLTRRNFLEPREHWPCPAHHDLT